MNASLKFLFNISHYVSILKCHLIKKKLLVLNEEKVKITMKNT